MYSAIIIFSVAFQPLIAPEVYAFEGQDGEPTTATLSVPTEGSPSGEVRRDSSFLFTWAPAAEHGAGYQLRVSGDNTQVGGAPDTSSAWYSPHLAEANLPASTVPNLGSGTWHWQVRVVDATGNKGMWSEVWIVVVDSEAPAIEIARPLEDELFGKSTTIPLEVTIGDRSGLTSAEVELDGRDITSELQSVPFEDGVRLHKDLRPLNLIDGAHVVRVNAIDGGGYSSEVTRSFTIDTHPPEITTTINEGQTVRGMVSLELLADELGTYAIRIMADGHELLAQEDTGLQTENAKHHVRAWNTWKVDDSKYTLIFTGRDAAGNESAIERRVVVANVAGAGMVVKDPLLEELRTSLNQPLFVPQATDMPPRPSSTVLTESSDIALEPYDTLLDAVPEFIPVVATENGWRLFGVLWYWWMLGGLLLAGGAAYAWRLVRAPIQQMPDSV